MVTDARTFLGTCFKRTPGMHTLLTYGANVVSFARLLLAGLWVTAFFSDHAQSHTLGVIAIGGAVSDFLDGPIARWTHSAGPFGRWLDNGADIVFILAALCCEAYAGVIPAYLPGLIAVSFVQYAVDSILIRGSPVPVKSRLGHWAGILNYIIVITLAWMPTRLAGTVPRIATPIIALFYVAAMCERAWLYRVAWPAERRSVRPADGE